MSIFSGITYGIAHTQPVINTPTITLSPAPIAQSITLSIDGVYVNKSVPIAAEETVLQVLEELNTTDLQLQLATKSYGEMGTLVESIGTQRNGMENKYWQYTVTDVAPMIGADAYILHGGESIQWQFKASTF